MKYSRYEELPVWKAGLNWYFRERRTALAPRPDGVPSLGRTDVGTVEWERKLRSARDVKG